MMPAEAAASKFKDFSLDAQQRYELEVAAWLHDCGKVTTPKYIVDKANKLETIFDRIHLIDARFAQLRREAELEHGYLKKLANPDNNAGIDNIELSLQKRLQQFEGAMQFLNRANSGGEFMSDEALQRIQTISTQTWRDASGKERPLLTPDEIENLTICKGTLTSSEREIINNHATMTIKMLKGLSFPKHLQNVPDFAAGHHERMDALRLSQSTQARSAKRTSVHCSHCRYIRSTYGQQTL